MKNTTEKNILQDGLSMLDFSEFEIETLFPRLERYIKEIQLFNSAYNLVNTSDYTELVIRHILDSLSPYKIIKEYIAQFSSKFSESPTIADIGSGAGLPGIPLAVIFPEINFTLVERMDKRCAFLENAIAMLGLSNTSVKKTEAERIEKESFAMLVFRAFRPLDLKMAKLLLSLVKPGGYIFAYKAKSENIQIEMNAISSLVGEWDVKNLSVPFLEDVERNLVVIKK